MSDLERQIRKQTVAGYERLGPVEDLLPPEMADTFGVEQAPRGTTILTPPLGRRTNRGWAVAAAAFVIVMLIAMPAILQLNQSESDVVAPPSLVEPTTLQPPRPGMVQNPGNGHFYEAVVLEGAVWTDVMAQAESLSFRGEPGHLVTITSEAEDSFVQEAFSDVLGDGPGLGGFQPEGSAEPGGGWQWVTGEPFTYTNWGEGELNNNGGNEDCLQYVSDPPRWNDTSCQIGGLFIIEYDTTPG